MKDFHLHATISGSGLRAVATLVFGIGVTPTAAASTHSTNRVHTQHGAGHRALRVTSLLALAAGPRASNSSQNGTAEATKFAWSLRVCNAYAFESGMEVFHTARKMPSPWHPNPKVTCLTNVSGPLSYKKCVDFGLVEGLGHGSQLSFQLDGGLQIASFMITALPRRRALLLLVVHRHDTHTTAAAFSSHVFDDSSNPEVALVDAYQGSSMSGVEVRSTNGKIRQPLRFGTAITLRPGWYEWLLTGDHEAGFDGGKAIGYKLNSNQKYVAMRVGADAEQGPSYSEQLVMFPQAWLSVHSFATRGCTQWLLIIWLTASVSLGLHQT